MRKEKSISHPCDIVEALKEAGLKGGTTVRIIFDSRTDRAVKRYVMEIEDAHKRAAKSTLIFKNPSTPSLQL